MKKMFDEVYIHAGLPKTGSSYLQSALELIERENGFSKTTYPVVQPNEDFEFIRSGNGLEIAKLLVESLTPVFDKTKLMLAFENLLDMRSSDKRNLLVSSEWFSEASPERFAYFREEILKVSNSIRVIVFIRPFSSWAWSLYNQGIKRHNLSVSFEEWAHQHLVDSFDRLMCNVSGFNVDIKFLPFNKVDLLPSLLSEVSEEKGISSLVPNKTVNRSLTEIEENLLKIANEVFNDSRISTAISDLLIKENTVSDSVLLSSEVAKKAEMYLPKVFSKLDSRFDTESVDEIKKLLLNDYSFRDSVNESFYKKDDVHEIVKIIFSAVLEMYSLSDKRLLRVMSCVNKLEKGRGYFDPVHYLLLNADVMDANIDPVKHFKKFGKKENRYTCLVDE